MSVPFCAGGPQTRRDSLWFTMPWSRIALCTRGWWPHRGVPLRRGKQVQNEVEAEIRSQAAPYVFDIDRKYAKECLAEQACGSLIAGLRHLNCRRSIYAQFFS